MNRCLLALVLLITITASAQSGTPTSLQADTADVQHVMDAYHEAVVNHDGARLASLFLPESVWINVLSDDLYARAAAKSSTAAKVRISSYKDFAKLVSTTKSNFNPTHTNLQIHQDGLIATVTFDFLFLADGKPTNRGTESWQLVHGADGWRISALIYSSNAVAPPA